MKSIDIRVNIEKLDKPELFKNQINNFVKRVFKTENKKYRLIVFDPEEGKKFTMMRIQRNFYPFIIGYEIDFYKSKKKIIEFLKNGVNSYI